ncbi:hypothetical protein [Polyangium sorediatum]|uniref:B box-type domain-containing protein n=1 Tax=Polyangium sorediatum TaxID=889274 RepID=A0ABT6NTV5_9BACT|nr:hypothetical protein [Polyangium sorediatum]MDI1431771.1 hypothetical protein [Polyangium sorediatum]
MAGPCQAHPGTNATHECTLCGALHCTPCLELLVTDHDARPMTKCPRCGAFARPLPAPERPEREDLMLALRRPFDEEGMLLLAALAAPYWLTALPVPQISTFFNVIYLGTLSTVYFQIVEHVGRDAPGLPFSARYTSRWDLFLSFLRGFVCVLGGFWPAIVSEIFLPGNVWLTLALVLIGVAMTPAVILAISLTGHTLNGLWPIVWYKIVAHDPRAYGRLLGQFVASTAAGVMAALLAAYTVGFIPFFGAYFVGLVITTAAVVQASLFGTWVRRHAWAPLED